MSFTATGFDVSSSGGSLGGLNASRMLRNSERNQISSTSGVSRWSKWSPAAAAPRDPSFNADVEEGIFCNSSGIENPQYTRLPSYPSTRSEGLSLQLLETGQFRSQMD